MDICLTIPFSTPESASLAYDVLNVDRELKGSGVQRILSTNSENLVIKFHAEDLKRLRKMPEHTPAPTPARSLYGFFLYLFSKTMLFMYCFWAFTPNSYLHYFNIYYYPQKYWATAIPIQFLVALTIFAFVIYPSSNLILTPKIDSINTISDPHAHYTYRRNDNNNDMLALCCICTDVNKCVKTRHVTSHEELEENIVPQLLDLNIRFVCKKLYFNGQSTQ